MELGSFLMPVSVFVISIGMVMTSPEVPEMSFSASWKDQEAMNPTFEEVYKAKAQGDDKTIGLQDKSAKATTIWEKWTDRFPEDSTLLQETNESGYSSGGYSS